MARVRVRREMLSHRKPAVARSGIHHAPSLRWDRGALRALSGHQRMRAAVEAQGRSESRSILIMTIVPLDLSEANELVARWHRHHGRVVGHKFSVGVVDDDGAFHGAAIVGRPVARRLDNGLTLEVTRCVTDGTPNAASTLYGACRRAAFALGYKRLVTYTLQSEQGGSLRGSGWRVIAESPGGSWSCPSRPRVDTHPLEPKLRWEAPA